jgi:cobalt-zinc-cadmium efflux system outer membrane protein
MKIVPTKLKRRADLLLPSGCLARAILLAALLPAAGFAQTAPLTWKQIVDIFEGRNPTLKAAQLNIDENKAEEITQNLRPNPYFSFAADGTQLTRYLGIYRPFSGTQISPSISYLVERAGKRALRLETAKEQTDIAASSYQDQERGLLFILRRAFVQILQYKVMLQNAISNLDYWDHELALNKIRQNAGDIAVIDYERLDQQRTQFEVDYETDEVNIRTAKIQLMLLIDRRTPLEGFDIAGPFEFPNEIKPLQDLREIALANRPDLRVAQQNLDLAKSTYKLTVANGSTDPTWSVWTTHNPSFANPYDYNTIGLSVGFPIRLFDRNQGEKARTQVDIARNERLLDANQAQVFNDVDSAYWTLVQNVNLLKPYKAKYLQMATDVRDKMSFSYRNGGSSLLDYLDAEKSYRDTRLAYLNLIGSYLTAAAQMNMAAGREVVE